MNRPVLSVNGVESRLATTVKHLLLLTRRRYLQT